MAMLRALLLAGSAIASASALNLCDIPHDCAFDVFKNGVDYHFDFLPLCRANGPDYIIADGSGHTYFLNICGRAAQNCLPKGYSVVYEYGVAVQMWGSTPPALSDCKHKWPGSPPANCTSPCEVLGVGDPIWALADSNNPATGGVVATFQSSSSSTDDPYMCQFNPATLMPYQRTVDFRFICDPSASANAEVMSATQNPNDNCDYEIVIRTSRACGAVVPPASTGMSNGSVFTIIVFSVAAVYIIGGYIFTYATASKIAHPHAAFWSNFLSLVRDGIGFTLSGFKSRPVSYGSVDTPSSSSSSSSGYGSATADSSKQYSDL